MKPELLLCLKQGYSFKSFGLDLLSGLLVAIIALPLSIALGIQSNATLQAGLTTAIVAGFFISAFGGSRFQIGGPTAAFVVIVFGYIADPEIGFLGLQIATIGAGVLLLLLGIFRAGGLIRLIPYPIVIGFTTGIGITLAIGQLKDFFGMSFTGSASEFIHKITLYAQNIHTIQFLAVGIGFFTLIITLFLPKVLKKFPAAFLAIVIASLLTILLKKISRNTVQIPTIGSLYGDVKATFDFIDFGAIGQINLVKLIVPAIVITFLGGVESLLSATVADGMSDTKHNPNQELLGQGLANIASPLFGGLPATGAIARTAANINAGAKSPLSGIFHALFLLIMYVALMPIVQYIPMSALAAVLLSVAFRMCKFGMFFRLMKVRALDTVVLVASCLLTVFFDLTYGVLGGLCLAILFSLIFVRHRMKINITDSILTEAPHDPNNTITFSVEMHNLNKANDFTNETHNLYNTNSFTVETHNQNNANDFTEDPYIENVLTEESNNLAEEIHVPKIEVTGSILFYNVDKLIKSVDTAFSDNNICILDLQQTRTVDLTAIQRISQNCNRYHRQSQELRIVHNPTTLRLFGRLT